MWEHGLNIVGHLIFIGLLVFACANARSSKKGEKSAKSKVRRWTRRLIHIMAYLLVLVASALGLMSELHPEVNPPGNVAGAQVGN